MFIATLFDEQIIKKKGYALKNLAYDSAITLASIYGTKIIEGKTHYEAMCFAEKIARKIINTTLNTPINFSTIWRKNSNGSPLNVTLKIQELEHKTFWYRFLNKISFSTPEISSSANLVQLVKNKIIQYLGGDNKAIKKKGLYDIVTKNGVKCIENLRFITITKVVVSMNTKSFIYTGDQSIREIKSELGNIMCNILNSTPSYDTHRHIMFEDSHLNYQQARRTHKLAVRDYSKYTKYVMHNNRGSHTYDKWLKESNSNQENLVSNQHYVLLFEDSRDNDFNDAMYEISYKYVYKKISMPINLKSSIFNKKNCS